VADGDPLALVIKYRVGTSGIIYLAHRQCLAYLPLSDAAKCSDKTYYIPIVLHYSGDYTGGYDIFMLCLYLYLWRTENMNSTIIQRSLKYP